MDMKPLITIRLELDLSPAMRALLDAITGHGTAQVLTPQAEAETAAKVEYTPHADEEPEVAAEEAPQSEEPKSKAPSKADVRTAMETKIADLNNEDGSRNEALYKDLKRTFKGISAELGADKPSELAEDRRQEFIDRVKNLQVSPEQILLF